MSGSKPTKDSANPNEELVEDLWTLVFNLEEDEYDVFSNNWIKDDEEIERGVFNAKYPPEKFNANVLAKRGQKYTDDWKTVTVKLIEKNYQSFEGAFTDMVRLTKGHRLKRDSDAELANSKRKRVMTKSIEDFFAGSSKKGKEPKHIKKPVLTEIPKFPVDTVNPKTPDARRKSTPEFHTPEDLSAVESTSSTKDRIHAESPPKRGHEKSSKDKHSSQSPSSLQKDRIHAESSPKRAHEKSSKDKHSSQSLSRPQQKVDSTPKDMSCEASGGCSFTHKYPCLSAGPIDLKKIACNQCFIFHTLMDKFATSSSSKKTENEEEKNPFKLPSQLPKDEVDWKLYNQLPFDSLTALRECEQELNNVLARQNLYSALSHTVSKGAHVTHTARSIMARILHSSLTGRFTWTGVNRQNKKDEREKNVTKRKYAFRILHLKDILLDAAMLIHQCHVSEDDIKRSVNQWFSQEALKFENKTSKPKNVPHVPLQESSESTSSSSANSSSSNSSNGSSKSSSSESDNH